MPIPNTLSASSLNVAGLCMDRWFAEYMGFARTMSNSAADVGTTCHYAFEKYVEAVYINKTHEPSFDLLDMFYQMGYVATFGTADMDTREYKDGYELIKKWFPRTKFDDREVLSVEEKKRYPVPFNHPDGPDHTCERCAEAHAQRTVRDGVCFIPFTYIIDRLDRLEDGIYEVVDYKSIRVPVNPEELEGKLQARIYALMIQIEHPDAEKIKVTFDLLRHETVSIWVTKAENMAFWKFLTEEVQRVVDTKESDIRPTLNPECGYCVKKATCPLIQKNMDVGGIHSLTIDQKIDLKYKVDAQVKAAGILRDELENEIMSWAAQQNNGEAITDWSSELGYDVNIGVGRKRDFDRHRAAQIMGPDLFAQLGSMTIAKLEQVIKDPSVDKEIRDQLSNLLYYTNGSLSLKIKKKPIGS